MAIAGRWRTFFRWRWIRSIGRISRIRMTTWLVHFARRRVRGIAGIMIRWRFGWRCLTSFIRLRRIRRLLLAGFARGRTYCLTMANLAKTGTGVPCPYRGGWIWAEGLVDWGRRAAESAARAASPAKRAAA